METDVPVTLTLKNIPDALYEQLKHSAALHRRSMNSEAIVRLEGALQPARMNVTERLARARALRSQLTESQFRPRDVDAMKREGRP